MSFESQMAALLQKYSGGGNVRPFVGPPEPTRTAFDDQMEALIAKYKPGQDRQMFQEFMMRSGQLPNVMAGKTEAANLALQNELIEKSRIASQQELTPEQLKALIGSSERVGVTAKAPPLVEEQIPSPLVSGLKAAGGAIPSAIANQAYSLTGGILPRSSNPNDPRLQALVEGVAERAPSPDELPGIRQLEALSDRAVEPLAISDAEAAANPYAILGGSVAGSLPLATIGPVASLPEIIGSGAFRALAQRVGYRAALAVAENAPQVFYQNLNPDQTIGGFAGDVGEQLGTIGAAGGIIGGLSRGGDAPARPQEPSPVPRVQPVAPERVPSPAEQAARVEEILSLRDLADPDPRFVPDSADPRFEPVPREPLPARGLSPAEQAARIEQILELEQQNPGTRISLQEAAQRIRSGIPEAQVRRELQAQVAPPDPPVNTSRQTFGLDPGEPRFSEGPRGSVAQVAEPSLVTGTMGARNVPEPPPVNTSRPDVIGGGLAAQPTPNPLPKIINENLNTERVKASQEALDQMYISGRIYGLDIKIAKGPKRSFQTVNAEAQKLLANPKAVQQLLAKPLGSSHTDVEGFVIREIYTAQAQHLNDVSEAFSKGEATAEAFGEAMDDFYQIELKRASAAAEQGRGLSAFNMIASGKVKPEVLEKLSAYISSAGGDPSVVASLMRKVNPKTLKLLSRGQKISNALHEFWIQALVSGSHVQNAVSGLAEVALDVPRRGMAAVMDVGGGTDRVRFGEIAESLPRMAGIRAALGNAWGYMKTGVPQHAAAAQQKIDTSSLPKSLENVKFIGTRSLGAVDEAFSMLHYTGEVSALAYRKAASEGLSGAAAKARIQQILQGVADGTEPEIHAKGVKKAERGTFRDDTWLGEGGGKLAQADIGTSLGISVKPMRWVIPFTRVGASMITNTVEQSPLGFITAPVRSRLGEGTGRRLSEDLARPAVGTLLGLTGYMLREAGYLTGDRRPDRSERDVLESQGWQPNSLKIGDKFISLERVEPIGSILLFTVNAINAFERDDNEEGNRLLNSIMTASHGVASDTWFKSIMDLGNLLDSKNPGLAAEKFAANLVAGFVPNLVRRPLKESGDTTVRQAKGFADRLGQNLGMASGKPRVNAFGREQGADKPLLDRVARSFGLAVSTAKADPVVQEYMRLGIAIAPPGTPGDADEEGNLIFKGLSPEKQKSFAKAKGDFMHEVASEVMSKSKYRRADDQKKDGMLRAARSLAAGAYHRAWRKHPDRPWIRVNDIVSKTLETERKPRPIDYEKFSSEVEMFEGLR